MKIPESCTTIALILVAAASGLLQGCHQQPAQQSPEPPKGISLQMPAAKPMRPQGLAAIKATRAQPRPSARATWSVTLPLTIFPGSLESQARSM